MAGLPGHSVGRRDAALHRVPGAREAGEPVQAARRPESRFCPKPPSAGQPLFAGEGSMLLAELPRGRRSLPASRLGLLFPLGSLEPRPPARHSQRRPGADSLRPQGPARFSPALQGGRLCCKQEPAHYINIIYPTVQKPSGCLPFPQRHLPASAPRALLPRTLQTAEPQRRYLQRIPANLNSPCPTRPSGK